ncbi:MAG: hypothetical protein ACHBN1_19635 [Heteroscytonema crispum UTEX LB 1556]
MSRQNEITGIILGILMLFGMHILAGLVIFVLGLIIGQIFGNYTFLAVWAIGGYGFLFWQLLYVIPLIFWLKRQQRLALMKGVIIGAVITALLNGGCSLLLVR